jgi:hypothetical protein
MFKKKLINSGNARGRAGACVYFFLMRDLTTGNLKPLDKELLKAVGFEPFSL